MKPTLVSACLACAFSFTTSATAQVLMLDFGVTTVADASRVNSPYHTANTSFTQPTWNKFQLADRMDGSLRWSDDSPAENITVNLGDNTNTVGVGSLTLGNQPIKSATLGGSVETGVYAGTAPGTDGIFASGANNVYRAIGFQVGGLSAGTYDIYLTGRNTNISSIHGQKFFAGKSSSVGDFDFSSYLNETLTYTNGATAETLQWVEGENYVKLSVTLSSGEFLNIASIGTSTNEARGFLNSVQIVNTSPIPEPSTFAALAGAGALLVAFSRRNRGSSRV